MRKNKALLILPMAGWALAALSGCSSNSSPNGPAPVTFVEYVTASPTPSFTPGGYPGATWTFTASFTPTRTPSSTPTSTPVTVFLTATFTITPTPTDTNTPTETATVTRSFTPTSSFTATPSATPTHTGTPTATGTSTFTPTPYYSYSYSLGNGQGTGAGQFEYPSSLAATVSGSTTLVYVSDQDNNRIQVYNSSTTTWTLYGGTGAGSGQGQFNTPAGIGVDGSGNIYVADDGNSRVQKFNKGSSSWSTLSLGTATVAGVTAGYFYNPSGLDLDKNGVLFVFDSGTSWINEYNGAWFLSNPVYHSSDGMGMGAYVNGAQETLYLAGYGDNHIYYEVLTSPWSNFGNGYGTGPGYFNAPVDVKADNKGNVFVSDSLNGRIQEFNSSGSFITQFAGPPAFVPSGIAVDNVGDVYASNTNGPSIEVFTYVP